MARVASVEHCANVGSLGGWDSLWGVLLRKESQKRVQEGIPVEAGGQARRALSPTLPYREQV